MLHDLLGTTVLPTGININPHEANSDAYSLRYSTMYVVQTDSGNHTFALCAYGLPDLRWTIGSQHELYHSGNSKYLGFYTVIGIVGDSNKTHGEIPNRKVQSWIITEY
jgi:hypothetical protein